MGAQSRPTILLTRPRAASRRFASSLRQTLGQGARICISPLMAPTPISAARPALLSGPAPPLVVFTSAEGVQGFARNWPDLRPPPLEALCVGPQTAAAAQRAGFAARAVGGGTAAALVAELLSRPAQPVLVVRGREAAHDVAASLTAAGRTAEACIVYAQEAQTLGAGARALLGAGTPLIVPMFSPRSAALMAAALRQMPRNPAAPLDVAAISPATAEAAAHLAPRRCLIAPTPDAAGMLTAVTQLVSMAQNTA